MNRILSIIALSLCSLSLLATQPTLVKNFSDLVRGGKNAQEVLQKELKTHPFVVIKCSMKKCGPCRAIEPIFIKMAQEYKDKAHFIALDVLKFEELAQQFTVKSVPTFLIFVRGKHLKTLSGANNIHKIKNYIKHQNKAPKE